MSTAVAFLSGKGGSGKTTLALSMADLLCRCGVNTLLVDCDLSTNGATYFYEAQLNEWNGSNAPALSFYDLLRLDDTAIFVTLEIKPQLDFIPSVPEISGKCLKAGEESVSDVKRRLSKFIERAKRNYDVVLFDCQAGYSEFLPALLPQVDVDLFVLEADNISSSAMRSLHLKIGDYLGSAGLYQVFNKATQEEFKIYSKIVGTFFTNIGTLLFDWKIRQAFSRSQVPDIESASVKYGLDLCDICKVMFRDRTTQSRLNHFYASIRRQEVKRKQEQVKHELKKLSRSRSFGRGASALLAGLLIIAAGAIAMILCWIGMGYDGLGTCVLISAVTMAFTAFMMFVFALDDNGESGRGGRQSKRWEYEKRLREYEEELLKLDEELMDSDCEQQDSVN